MNKKVFGTREWSSHSFNISRGCTHNCRYCYARSDALKRFKTIKTSEEWKTVTQLPKALSKKWSKKDGTIMFPTQHDIVPENIDDCIVALTNMLKAGNNVLIVSKPHIECIWRLCDSLKEYKDQILFRFTIGSDNDEILSYWEPGAPSFAERLTALKFAFHRGFQTSVSMEPVLDWLFLIRTYNKLSPYVTNSIWIGMMNFIDKRVDINSEEDRKQVERIKKYQECEWYLNSIYLHFKDHPLIKWKESMKDVLNLEIPEEIGLDL